MYGGNTSIYLIPIGKSSSTDDISYQTPPYLFTVETDAGVYKDCICMLYEVSEQLIDIENGISVLDSDIP